MKRWGNRDRTKALEPGAQSVVPSPAATSLGNLLEMHIQALPYLPNQKLSVGSANSVLTYPSGDFFFTELNLWHAEILGQGIEPMSQQ